MPHSDYFKWVKEILNDEDILFICDEVQTGFGRTGKMFAIEHYGVEPDIMTLGKGIANGFPVSAFIARPGVSEAFTPGDHLSTFGGNPVSCCRVDWCLQRLSQFGIGREANSPEAAV